MTFGTMALKTADDVRRRWLRFAMLILDAAPRSKNGGKLESNDGVSSPASSVATGFFFTTTATPPR